MNKRSVLERIRGGLIVSCQAVEGEPLHGADTMTKMALAAKMGGAVGIRANGAEDIRRIKACTELPVIGIVKRVYEDSEVYITSTLREVEEVVEAGADIVAVDATMRRRPGNLSHRRFWSGSSASSRTSSSWRISPPLKKALWRNSPERMSWLPPWPDTPPTAAHLRGQTWRWWPTL